MPTLEAKDRIKTPFRVSRRTKTLLPHREDYLWYAQWRLAKTGQRPLLRKTLANLVEQEKGDWRERLTDWCFYLGQRAFHGCTPRRLHHGSTFLVAALQLTVWIVFFYMAAEYPRFLVSTKTTP